MSDPAIASWIERRMFDGSQRSGLPLTEFRQVCMRAGLDQFEAGDLRVKPLPPEAPKPPDRIQSSKP